MNARSHAFETATSERRSGNVFDPSERETIMDMTLAELAASIGGQLTDESVGERRVAALRSLEAATEEDVSFFRGDPRYLPQVRATKALAIIADGPIEGVTRPLVLVEDAGLATSFLLAAVRDIQNPPPAPGVHRLASVDPTAELGPDVSVGPFAVVEAGARIGARSRIGAHAFVGRNAVLGEECTLHPGSMVLHSCKIGARLVLWPYAVIGRDGFGFLQRDGRHVRVPQVGGVTVGDDVEIGCWTSVDRGAVDPTVVGEGVKVDSHCHIAHNCKIGDHAILIGYARMGGSVSIGKNAILGQDARVGERRKVGDGGILGSAGTALYQDVPAGQTYMGTPSMPFTQAKRVDAVYMRLPEMHKELRDLRKRLDKLEGTKKPRD